MMFCTTVPVHCGVVRDFLIRAVSVSVELKLKILEDEKKNYLTASPNDPAQRVEMQILAVYGWGKFLQFTVGASTRSVNEI